jgi:hypothetical protein
MTYSLKAIKTFHGHDGPGCWEAKLYQDKTFVAIVVEDGWGGELQFHWQDATAPKVEGKTVNYKDEPVTYKATPYEADLLAHCLSLPKQTCYDDKLVHVSHDVFVSDLVEAKLTEKDVKRLLKKVAVFDEGKFYTFNIPANQLGLKGHPSSLRDIVLPEKYPNAIILNDLPLEKAVEYYRSAA